MKITLAWLKKHNACAEGMEYCEQKGLIGLPADEFAEKLVEGNKLPWANWLIARALQKLDKVRYAVYAAEQVLPIFTGKYPKDDRPEKAIAAAKAYIENPCAYTADAADAATDATHAAADAAYAADDATDAAYAADDAAYAATDAAAYAAYAATDAAHAAAFAADAADDATDAAADAAADDAADAAYAAAYAADAAADDATDDGIYEKILRYGINLLKNENRKED